jgi:DNA-binding Lrp family transcriptional regulator
MKEVLEILENNARATPEQISTMLGITVAEVEKTIKEAEEQRAILKYKTIINWAKLGEQPVLALIEVKVTPQRDVGFDSIAERICGFSEVHSAYLVSGTYDLAILVKGKNMHEIASFVSGKLAPLNNAVQSTVTHFLLKQYKEQGELLETKEEVKRLPITP